MNTYTSVGAALADPKSNIARVMRESQAAMAHNRTVIDALVAQGMTREQAWAEAIKTASP